MTIPDEEVTAIITTLEERPKESLVKLITQVTQQSVRRKRRSETCRRWKEYKERNNSFIDHYFTGLYRSTVSCERCLLTSVTYDPFLVISLPVTAKSLSGCLTQFLSEERLANYYCIGCT
jgi:ubiquitin C-terminal hydrolase